jgi:hypothetical protein
MNAFLANLYKTAESIGGEAAAAQPSDDTEKLAQAAVLDQMFKNDGLDISQVDDATILKVATEVFGPDNEIAKLAQAGGATSPAPASGETDEEKVAQADYLGRVMAHAYVQELANIEKEAQAKQAATEKQAGAKETAGKALKAVGGAVKDVAEKHRYQAALAGKGVKGHAKALAHEVGGHAAVGAAGGAGGYAAGKKKESSAIDMLAQQKVAEILAANGIEPEKVAAGTPSDKEKLAQAVDARVREILAEKGYTLE